MKYYIAAAPFVFIIFFIIVFQDRGADRQNLIEQIALRDSVNKANTLVIIRQQAIIDSLAKETPLISINNR